MEVRPFVTKGIALASAGLLVAAVPTIAPPLTPRDVQVAADVQTQLAVANTGFPALPDAASLLQGLQLAANADSTAPSLQQVVVPTLQELVDAFFDGTTTPAGDEVPAGITSVAYLLTKAVLPTAPFVDSFFSGGFVAVTQEFLDFLIPGSTTMTVAPADDTVAPADATAQQVVVPTLQELVDAFFDGTTTPAGDEVPAGITSVAYLLTKAVLPTAPFVDSFFSGGFVAVTQEFLDFLIPGSTTMTVAPADDTVAPADATAQQVVVPTLQELVDAFFDGTTTPAGDEVPAGITSVAYLLTKAVLPTAPFVDSFFSGGFVAVTQEFLDFLIPGSTTMTVAPADSETTEDSTVEEPTETAGTTGLFRSDLFGFGLPAVNETINRAASLPGVSTSTQTDEVEESVTEIVAEDEATKDETTKDETTKDETTKDETTKDETTKDETTKDETTKDETTKDETTKDETTKDETTKDETTKDETTENGKVTDRKVTENGKKFIPGSRDEKKPGAEGNGWGRARDASKNFNGGGASADNNDANAGDDNGTSNEHDS